MKLAWFGVLKVAHRKAREKAFELFEQGWFAPETSGALNVSLRTVQRWRQEFTKEKNDGNSVTSSAENSDEIVAANLVENPVEQLRTLDHKNWFDFATKLSNEHFLAHNEVRTKIQKILNQKLDETNDLNLRSIHTLSLSFNRHLEGERVAASLEFLDLNRAALRVEATGLIISDPAAVAHEVEEEE